MLKFKNAGNHDYSTWEGWCIQSNNSQYTKYIYIIKYNMHLPQM